MKILVAGAGGFIGGHLVKSLLAEGHDLVCADLKPIEYWFQVFEKSKKIPPQNHNKTMEFNKKSPCSRPGA